VNPDATVIITFIIIVLLSVNRKQLTSDKRRTDNRFQ